MSVETLKKKQNVLSFKLFYFVETLPCTHREEECVSVRGGHVYVGGGGVCEEVEAPQASCRGGGGGLRPGGGSRPWGGRRRACQPLKFQNSDVLLPSRGALSCSQVA